MQAASRRIQNPTVNSTRRLPAQSARVKNAENISIPLAQLLCKTEKWTKVSRPGPSANVQAFAGKGNQNAECQMSCLNKNSQEMPATQLISYFP